MSTLLEEEEDSVTNVGAHVGALLEAQGGDCSAHGDGANSSKYVYWSTFFHQMSVTIRYLIEEIIMIMDIMSSKLLLLLRFTKPGEKHNFFLDFTF